MGIGACRSIGRVYSEIASNKRRSVIFVGLFFVLWLAIGAVAGLILRAVDHPINANGVQTSLGWTPVIAGMVICGVLAVGGIVYSLNSGAALVLRVSGAVPADPAKYQQLYNLVGALAVGDGIPTPAVYVIDDPSPNAFATGVSPDKAAITFTTGLLAISLYTSLILVRASLANATRSTAGASETDEAPK